MRAKGSLAGRFGAVAVAVLAASAYVLPAAGASPADSTLPTAKVDCVAFDTSGKCVVLGVVYAMTQVGGRTYIGGSFTSVNKEPRANVAAVLADGTLDPSWTPSTDGTVYAMAASADGTKIYLGGGFTAVNGAPQGRLAAVTSDTGSLVPGWSATPSNNLVRALVADEQDRLFVGGNFSRIGGRAIARLAAVSQSTGAVDPGFVPAPSNTVRALALSDDGTRLYAGGSFTAIGGASRPGAGELDATSGRATSFAPTDGGVVIAMDVSSSGRLFFGTTSNRTWAYDVADGGVPEYRVRTAGDVQAILALDDEVFIGGHFDTLPEAKLERMALASFRPSDGTATSWNPGANGPYGVWAIGLTRTGLSADQAPALSIGGDFTRVGTQARRGYARFAFPG